MSALILAPACAAGDVPVLMDAGARELYCGFHDDEWTRRFGPDWWPNRRPPGPANVGTLSDLVALGDAATAAKLPLFLTMNATLYTGEQVDHLVEVAARAVQEAGVSAVVAADPTLLLALLDDPRVPRVFVSTVGAALNSRAVAFYSSFGARRVILSRNLHVKEIAALREAVGDVEVAAYVVGDHCRFEEAMCSTTHCVPGSPLFCSQHGQRSVMKKGREVGGDELRRWQEAWQQGLDLQVYVESSIDACQNTSVLGQCGLCALPDIVRAGVDSLKVLGREAPLNLRAHRVELVARLLQEWSSGRGLKATRRLARELRGEPDVCESGTACLYHDLPNR